MENLLKSAAELFSATGIFLHKSSTNNSFFKVLNPYYQRLELIIRTRPGKNWIWNKNKTFILLKQNLVLNIYLSEINLM